MVEGPDPAVPTATPAPAGATAPTLVLPPQIFAPEWNQSKQGSKTKQSGESRGSPGGLRFVWREHPSIRAGRNFRLDFAAKFQFDSRDPGDDPVEFETHEVHRMRVGIEGQLFRHIQYNVERELTERELVDPEGPGENSKKNPWKDVFVEADYTSHAQFRFGRFKVPFGLDETSGEADLDFIYRSLGGRYLAPGRDTGVVVHGRLFHRIMNYRAGWFEHDGDNSRSKKIQGGDETIAARVALTPFRNRKKPALEGT